MPSNVLFCEDAIRAANIMNHAANTIQQAAYQIDMTITLQKLEELVTRFESAIEKLILDFPHQ